MTALEGYCQKTDTICVPKADLIRKLKQVEDLKVQAAEADQLRGQNKDLAILLAVKDVRIENYENQAFNYTRQIRLKDETITLLNKSLKKQKLKTVAAGVAGILLTTSIAILFNR